MFKTGVSAVPEGDDEDGESVSRLGTGQANPSSILGSNFAGGGGGDGRELPSAFEGARARNGSSTEYMPNFGSSTTYSTSASRAMGEEKGEAVKHGSDIDGGASGAGGTANGGSGGGGYRRLFETRRNANDEVSTASATPPENKLEDDGAPGKLYVAVCSN